MSDAPEQLQQQYFAQLSVDPRQAMGQAQTMLQSSQWREQERQLIKAWRNVIRGRALEIHKYHGHYFHHKNRSL
ncbi:DUF1525 domain-containing protein [Xenorhabdus bovienii]|uniref:Uncharacterized protein n=3 Tax=Xenorhabdus bovienii TaxID=40576 RepID=A0A0B6XGQ7_XENBV|nr:DUF1525 domain-containing protein [Xenorhabdus bovienii]CDG99195.1 conserved hypothetical protein [Xenorhabdus bovienii str. puntauvense]CDH02206.1 conserved hypothetical protein [Xenorhabdus bovienii str. feltiae Moldova]CDM92219.1 conserved protein of unknown function [Xenorhabdus bovienii]